MRKTVRIHGIFERSLAERPAGLLDDVLNHDYLPAILSDMKARGIAIGIGRKSVAASAPVSEIAEPSQPLIVRLEGRIRGAALAFVWIAERQTRRDCPRAALQLLRRIEVGARHSGYSST